ncbi:MAG TPA: UDP-N-acetylmuramoyl-L-alanyl-D-glutamate--2,6-diaminopimelate ligase [Eubacteriaceae bacterium]|nr:UDP-N-acetylmuramoyl-L-alanyl-D-glutamate--2,6-diaminopimelate ligase [Eubacteriaceae bacterium]
MNLKDIIKELDIELYIGSLEKEISDITYDSREAMQNSLFVAIRGYSVDGHDYIDLAIKKGAIAVVCEVIPEIKVEGVTYIQVKDSRMAQGFIANKFFKEPSKRLSLIGITGTNGKTSVVYIISRILEKWGKKTGNIGTLGNYIGENFTEAKNTTPEAIDLQRMLSQMVEQDIEYGVMEVSSHSLSLNRVVGNNYSIGIFTNLSQDHLDFHLTKENYFQAKSKLFNLTHKANIINGDDPYGIRLIEKLKKHRDIPTYSYGITNKCDFLAKDIHIDNKGLSFLLEGENIKENFRIGIPGIFSVYNAMASIISCYIEQVPIDIIKGALKEIKAVPGRLEVVDTNTPYSVIIDYAHTPDGLENVLKTIKTFSKNRLILVFGCGGDRDKTKRPIMGEIGARYSDFVIVTSDNPRSEDPHSIIEDILPGVEGGNCPYKIIENRREAIREALSMGKKDDIILIAGKGHETYQILKDKTIPFNEKEIIKEILEEDEKNGKYDTGRSKKCSKG